MSLIDYGYRYIDEIATADAAFEVFARSDNELFRLAAEAMFGIMIDLNSVGAEVDCPLDLHSDSLEELLYLYLSELIYLKDTEQMLFVKFDVQISGRFKLYGNAHGQKVDRLKIQPRIDIKGVTFHHFNIQQNEDGYRAVVVVDL